jgi:hypothetical protein
MATACGEEVVRIASVETVTRTYWSGDRETTGSAVGEVPILAEGAQERISNGVASAKNPPDRHPIA